MVGLYIKKWLKERNSNYKRQRDEINKAWDFFDDRQHEKAEQLLKSILQEKYIHDDVYISCLILQSELLNRTGRDFKKSYEIASHAVSLAEKIQDPLLLLEAYLSTISSLIDVGEDTTINKLFEKVDQIFEKNKLKNNGNLNIKAKYYGTKGLYYGHLGKIDLSLEYYLKCSDLEEKMGKTYNLVSCLNNVGLCYSIKGEFQKSINYLLNVIDIVNKSHEESKYDYILAHTYGNLGTQFSDQGELDKGLEYLQKSLELSISTSNIDSQSICLANIGDTLLKKGDYNQAIQKYKEALDLFIQSGNQRFEMTLLIALLLTYMFTKDENNKKFYFEKITSKFNEHSNDEFFSVNYLFSKALMLKESARLSDRVEAQKIFKEINNKNEFYSYITKESILYYLELLLDELKYSPNDALMDEIVKTNKKLMELAKNQASHILIAESMLINAKINILELNFDQARLELTQAQISAEERGLKLLSQKISNEHDNLLLKMNQWENILDDSSSIQERLELANLEEILRNMIQRSYNMTEEEQEKGLILLIANTSGLSIFSRKFLLDDQVEDQIVAGLLTAINTFSQETFKTEDSVERIKLGSNTVIIKKISDFNVCYAFKGPSYYAGKKVDLFIKKIQDDKQIIEELHNYRTFLPKEINQKLNKLVDIIFNSSETGSL